MIVVFILIGIFNLTRFIKVTNIVCESQYGPCTDNITEKVSKLVGLNLSVTKSKLTQLFSEEPYVDKFSYQFQFPSRLHIQVVEKKPKFALKNQSQGLTAILARDGKVLSLKETSTLPTIDTDETLPNVGDNADSKDLFALEIVYALTHDYKIKSARANENHLVIEVIGGPRVIFPLEGDKDLLLGSFVLLVNGSENLIKNSTVGGLEGKIVDFRFKKPVITDFKKTTGVKPVDELNSDMSSSFRGNPARKSGEDVIRSGV